MYLGLNRLGVSNRRTGSSATSGPPVSAGKLLWLDASDAGTVATSGSNITSWTNKVGASEAFTLGGGSSAVTLDTTTFALNSISFGDAAAVRFLTNATGVAITESSTIFVVSYWRNVAKSTMALALHKGTALNSITTTAGRPLFMVFTPSNGSAQFSAQPSGTVYKESTTPAQAKGAKGQWTVRMPDPNTAGVIRLNGANQALTAGASTDVPAGMVINSLGSSDNTYTAQGNFGEILIYNSALSDADMAATEAYLKAKWGTP